MTLDTQGEAESDLVAGGDVEPVEREPGLFDGLGTRLRRPRRPWLAALVVLVAVLLVAEGYVRLVEEQLPTVRAGDAAEMIIKTGQIDDLVDQGGAQVDVVFFGTSMMDSAASPTTFLDQSDAFDTAYNASVVGAPLSTQVRWAEEIVLDRLDPGMIVLGVHPVDLLLTGVLDLNIEAAQADVVFSRVLRETSDGPVGAADRFLHDHLALVRQRGSLRRPEVMWEATLDTVLRRTPREFFALRDEAFWAEHLSPLGESSLFAGEPFKLGTIGDQLRDKLTVDAFATADLERLLDVAVDAGVPVVVVIPPIPLASWQQAGIDMGAVASGIATISTLAAERDIPVLDFTDQGYPDELFADMMHANDRGAVAFTTQITPELDSLG